MNPFFYLRQAFSMRIEGKKPELTCLKAGLYAGRVERQIR